MTTCYKNAIEYREGKGSISTESNLFCAKIFPEYGYTTHLTTHLTTQHQILHGDLYLHPYKMQIMQQLQCGNLEKCKKFCECTLSMIELDSHFVENIMFTDDAYLDFFENGNKQNMCYYSQTNPQLIMEKPLHLSRVTV